MGDNITTPSRLEFQSAGAVRRRPSPVEIPQPPRFAVQRLVGEAWETITFDDCGPDHPYDGRPLLYQSRYLAEHVAKLFGLETVRVIEQAE